MLCKNCNKDFVKNSNAQKYCIDCKDIGSKSYQKIYRDLHKDKMGAYQKEYYLSNKKDIKEYDKLYYLKNKEKRKLYLFQNKNRIYSKMYEYRSNRRLVDPSFKLRYYISSSVSNFLKSNSSFKNNKSILNALPYTIDELKLHIESLFESWMNWNNHGRYDPKTWNDDDSSTWTWQLDHVIPHSTFKYTLMDSEDFCNCWALVNLRPLSAKQNILKGSRLWIIEPQ